MPWLTSTAAAIASAVQWLCAIVSAITLATPTGLPVAQPRSNIETTSRISVRATSAPAAFVMDRDVTARLEQLSPTLTDDEPIRVIAAGPNRIGIFVVGRPRRTGPPQSHRDGSIQVTEGLQLDEVSSVVRVLKGAGTIVTGGTLVNSQRMPGDDPDAEVIGPGMRGSAILGGQSRRVSAGDMVIIPAGVAHGFSEIETPITYLVIRVDAARGLPLN